MSYSGSDSIGLLMLMPNGNSYDYPALDPSYPFNEELSSEYHSLPFWTEERGFPSRHQSDGDPIGDNFEGEQTNRSCFGYLMNQLDSTSYSEICRDLFFNCQDPYAYGNQIGCRMENTEDILHDGDQLQVQDYNGDSRNLGYESVWDCFQTWFGFGEDEHGHGWNGEELKPACDYSSDAMALFEAILGY